MSEQLSAPLRLFVIAGEPSGDLLGGMVLEALNHLVPKDAIQISGVGGEMMAAAGLHSLFPMRDITAFGLAEILPRIPAILRRVRETAAALDAFDPDIILTIDAPDFCFRVLRKRTNKQTPVVHLVAPTVWAWRPKRAKKIARYVQHLLCLFPFEPPYFTKEGLAATAIGHPITVSMADKGDADRFRAQHHISAQEQILTILLGSRVSEITKLADIFTDTVRRLCARNPSLRLVVPTIPDRLRLVQQIVADWPGKPVIVTHQQDKYDAFAASRAAMAASGTVSLELGMAGVPHIIAYRVHPISAWIFRRLATTRFVNIVNIAVADMVVPECLQEQCTPDMLMAAIEPLIAGGMEAERQKRAFDQVMTDMGRGRAVSPAQEAAQIILEHAVSARNL